MSQQQINIGVLGLTKGWSDTLITLGIPHSTVSPGSIDTKDHSLLILNRSLSTSERTCVDTFVQAGGAVLETGKSKTYFTESVVKRFKTIQAGYPLRGIEHITSLDLYSKTALIKGARFFEGMIHIPEHPEDRMYFFGADPDAVLYNMEYHRKTFSGIDSIYPDELVCQTNKSDYLKIVECILRDIHLKQDLPFVQKWHSPTNKLAFAFRIDTDYGDQESIRQLERVSVKHQIPFTWFLHIKAHEEWLDMFNDIYGEVAFHGYDHATTTSKEVWDESLSEGLKKMHDAGFDPKGFCAPYGIFNKGLNTALQGFNFSYTSEFTVAFDGLPIPTPGSDRLQVPVHPICTGSLSRAGGSEDQMQRYFTHILNKKLQSFEPVIFYHHPLQAGLEMWDQIFNELDKTSIEAITFGEYADFWSKRNQAKLDVSVSESGVLDIDTDPDIYVRVWTEHHRFSLINGHSDLRLSDLNPTHEINSTVNTLQDPEKNVKSRLSLFKTSILDWRNRKRL